MQECKYRKTKWDQEIGKGYFGEKSAKSKFEECTRRAPFLRYVTEQLKKMEESDVQMMATLKEQGAPPPYSPAMVAPQLKFEGKIQMEGEITSKDEEVTVNFGRDGHFIDLTTGSGGECSADEESCHGASAPPPPTSPGEGNFERLYKDVIAEVEGMKAQWQDEMQVLHQQMEDLARQKEQACVEDQRGFTQDIERTARQLRKLQGQMERFEEEQHKNKCESEEQRQDDDEEEEVVNEGVVWDPTPEQDRRKIVYVKKPTEQKVVIKGTLTTLRDRGTLREPDRYGWTTTRWTMYSKDTEEQRELSADDEGQDSDGGRQGKQRGEASQFPLIAQPHGEAPVYRAWKIGDLTALLDKLPPITRGAPAWLRKVTQMTQGTDLAMGEPDQTGEECVMGAETAWEDQTATLGIVPPHLEDIRARTEGDGSQGGEVVVGVDRDKKEAILTAVSSADNQDIGREAAQ